MKTVGWVDVTKLVTKYQEVGISVVLVRSCFLSKGDTISYSHSYDLLLSASVRKSSLFCSTSVIRPSSLCREPGLFQHGNVTQLRLLKWTPKARFVRPFLSVL